MRPILFELFGMAVPAFFFTIMVGSLVAIFYAAHEAKKENLSPVMVIDLGIIAILSAVLGARIFHILVEYPSYYWADPIRVFYFWQGGFVSIGAYIGAAVACVWYMKFKKVVAWRYVDLLVKVLPIVIFCVRAGCLLVGCCYGKPTDFWLHLTFHDPASTAYYYHPNIPLHATQIYFMFSAVVLFFLLHFVYKKKKFMGQVTSVFLMYYGISRFLIEFLRGDDDRGLFSFFGVTLSTGQISMLCAFFAGVILWKVMKKKSLPSNVL
ncbi:MAG: hypothetical protein COX62_04440 [Deltaproteobacteria bacterium CG_4_10_14_0_2_um_filter_43_8]|nr:MAG: hypothetical protein COV43_05170 [Deltaproteobacteria bacterium CG11_big_fil_rev_8_21_14_0_20_42_23]PJA20587.1 MAG: hypothetical protein COX62_04440 [Deltaproteobacteria bacterium CG_4_10_14_0_2_um_filter_43_8]PJC63621.1 MAG: hypothetical protein CO021_08650 [Deltaproteobacteria bacterium CG_4_9_14_0_2_um_filter_42_21]